MKLSTIKSWEYISNKDRGLITVKKSKEKVDESGRVKRRKEEMGGIGWEEWIKSKKGGGGGKKIKKKNNKVDGNSKEGEKTHRKNKNEQGWKLYVSNLPLSIPTPGSVNGIMRPLQPSDVVTYFGGNGVVRRVKLYRDKIRGGVLKGDGVVTFIDEGGMRRGLEGRDGVRWMGRVLKCQRAEFGGVIDEGRFKGIMIWNLYNVNDVPGGLGKGEWYTDLEEDVRGECGKFGVVVNVEVGGSSSGVKVENGCVRVEFENVEDAGKAARGLRGRIFDGRTVAVEWEGEEGEEGKVVGGSGKEEGEEGGGGGNIEGVEETEGLDEFFSSLL